ncbi:MAG: prepilin-type N-terminal cleavage/methylation domain-containing protein [Chlamydiae bacterium]|nr:prepilin-type N-terminal cleavage/methylation domain-containing protein [Chlamydiota bacterium]MBI3276877.1 prepilin-type N-terminal cleavage/methylation domain-containing protein [Chlamydiota bacterium]
MVKYEFIKETARSWRLEAKSQNAFTLFEIVVALGVLAIGVLGVLALFPVGLDTQKRALDYSNIAILAEWKMADIYYRSHLTGSNNSLTAYTSYPTGQSTPTPFAQNPKYSWRYNVSKPFSDLANFYRVDLYIYSINDLNNPAQSTENYYELPTN